MKCIWKVQKFECEEENCPNGIFVSDFCRGKFLVGTLKYSKEYEKL